MFLVPPHIENAGEEDTFKVPEGHPVTWSCLASGEHQVGKGGGMSKWEMGHRGRPESHFGVWSKWMSPVRDMKTAEIGCRAFLGTVLGFAVVLSGKRWGGDAHMGSLFHNVSSNLSQMELKFL